MIHRFELHGAHAIGVRTVFVIEDKVVSYFVAGRTFFGSHGATFRCDLGPYRCGLDVDARTYPAIGLCERFMIDGVYISIVINYPIAALASLFGPHFL